MINFSPQYNSPQIRIFGSDKYPLLVLSVVALDDTLNASADEAWTTGYEYNFHCVSEMTLNKRAIKSTNNYIDCGKINPASRSLSRLCVAKELD